MNIFFDLLDVHQIAIVTEWLGFKDFVRLNSAACNQGQRAEFLNIVATEQCIFKIGPFHTSQAILRSMDWIVGVRIRSRKYELTGLHLKNTEVRRRILQHLSSSLEDVTILLKNMNGSVDWYDLTVDWSSVFLDLADFCSNLKHLNLWIPPSCSNSLQHWALLDHAKPLFEQC